MILLLFFDGNLFSLDIRAYVVHSLYDFCLKCENLLQDTQPITNSNLDR